MSSIIEKLRERIPLRTRLKVLNEMLIQSYLIDIGFIPDGYWSDEKEEKYGKSFRALAKKMADESIEEFNQWEKDMNKLARQRAFEILGKHCPNGLSTDGVIDALVEALEEFPPATKGESSTNSNPGSSHWFNTIMGKHLHIGEFLKEKLPTEDVVKEWGQTLFDTSKEVINWFEDIGKKDDFIPPSECDDYDEAQGRYLCRNAFVETKRCVGTKCGHFTQKK